MDSLIYVATQQERSTLFSGVFAERLQATRANPLMSINGCKTKAQAQSRVPGGCDWKRVRLDRATNNVEEIVLVLIFIGPFTRVRRFRLRWFKIEVFSIYRVARIRTLVII
jgi:hypothetical protein